MSSTTSFVSDYETGSNVIELPNHFSWKVLEGGHGLVIYCGGQGCNGFVVPDDAQSGDTGGEEECFDSLGTAYHGSGISSYLNETDYGPNEKLGCQG